MNDKYQTARYQGVSEKNPSGFIINNPKQLAFETKNLAGL